MRSSFADDVAVARPRVVAVVRRIAGDDAEDVVQEAILRAFLSLPSLRDHDRFEAWLCGIALNVAKMRLRRAATEARLLGSTVASNGLHGAEERELLDAVHEAVAVLPPGRREAVLLHYVDGLSCEEIAALVGSTPGAIRVRLHRARAQLREELAVYAPTPTTKGATMIEMKVADVLVRRGDGSPETVIVLEEARGKRRLPIWVGSSEGMALGYRLVGDEPLRPLTSDLMTEMLRVTGAHVVAVAITAIRDNVFYGSVNIDGVEIDARPSDALNLALRTGTPILVADDVLEASGPLPREPDGEWDSVTSELLRALHPPPRKE